MCAACGCFAASAGVVAGSALQLQQPALWSLAVYTGLAMGGAAGLLGLWRRRGIGWRALFVIVLLGALAGAGLTAWRAVVFTRNALPPAIEGRDLRVAGVVAQMPQRNDSGVRFTLEVESAGWADAAVDEGPPRVPPRIAPGWYAAARGDPAGVHAGERWRMTVRLKAPHGHLNPHGFDQELRLWEQGVQATGTVRTGARDAPPERIGATWRHPVERVRESVCDAILARVDDRQAAGVIAALLAGDQNAFDRVDWDVSRATGVAHLMAISGLHATLFAWFAAQVVGALWRRSARLMLWWPAQHAGLLGGVLLATPHAVLSGWGLPSRRCAGCWPPWVFCAWPGDAGPGPSSGCSPARWWS
jgi:competence protein ComEC